MSQPKTLFADLLASLASVRTFLGAADAAAAAARIHVDTLPRPTSRDAGYTLAELQALRPFILVSQGERRRVRASSSTFTGTLEITVTMEKDPAAGYDASQTTFDAATAAWDTTVDGIEAEILSSAYTSTLQQIVEVTGSKGWSPEEVHHDEGEFQGAEWTFTVML